MYSDFRRLKSISGFIYILLVTGFLFALPAFGSNIKPGQDSSASAAIKGQIINHQSQLHYPLSVMRFYKQANFKLTWIAPNTVKTHTWEAMMLLDCMVQYGLNHADYHPQELLYDILHQMIDHPEKSSINDKATFDIYLTDAIISFINNIHYGKLNPVYPAKKVDAAVNLKFSPQNTLLAALQSSDFDGTIDNVQPKSEEYKNLKNHMRLLTGLYTLDCYETPEADIRKMAINMERLRWVENNDIPYILINMAGNNLRLYELDGFYQFDLITGKALPYFTGSSNPIAFITTKLNGQISFGQAGINVKRAEKLAVLLLAYDKNAVRTAALSTNQKRVIRLKKPVRLNMIYLTCEVIEGVITFYKDTSQLDKKLESEFYNMKAELAFK